MKVIAFDEPREEELSLRLLTLRPGSGSVSLCVVDEDGRAEAEGVLLTVSDRGLSRVGSVDAAFGLPLDGDGRVKFDDERRDPRLDELLNLIKPFVEYIKRRDADGHHTEGDDNLLLRSYHFVKVGHFRALANFYDEVGQ